MECLQDNSSITQGKILCCQCGTLIDPNPMNMCVACIRTHVDITEGIPKQVSLQFCRNCERYLQPPSTWIRCALESRELLSLCLKKLKGLGKVRLVDANFVWTEPHSKRIKVRLSIQAELQPEAVLQQVFVVEYNVHNQMCPDCHRVEAKDHWNALVQVRQKTDHKKTFFYLEQLILKHKAHEHTIGIKLAHEGLDFYYSTDALARKMVDYLMAVVPSRFQQSKKLISHDIHSNTYNYKTTFSVEIVPVCKDSVVCLPPKLAHQLGGISQLCIVSCVSSVIRLIDPATAQIAEFNSMIYWRYPFTSLCTQKHLIEYTVMDVEEMMDHERVTFSGQGALSMKHSMADVWVVKSSELGISTDTIHCRSHLGRLLKPGDAVLGYDIINANLNDKNFDKLRKDRIPDVIIVKKVFGDRRRRHKKRKWKLQHMDIQEDNTSENRDYLDFLDDLEEDPSYRENVNIYRDKSKMGAVDTEETDEEDYPTITIQEMLEDLHIHDEPDEQREDACMME